MADASEENARIDGMARRMCDDAAIATPTLIQILNTVDGEIAALRGAGEPVSRVVAQLREVVSRACLMRREDERSGSTRSSR